MVNLPVPAEQRVHPQDSVNVAFEAEKDWLSATGYWIFFIDCSSPTYR